MNLVFFFNMQKMWKIKMKIKYFDTYSLFGKVGAGGRRHFSCQFFNISDMLNKFVELYKLVNIQC
jgi:hypothetical protein